MDRCNLILDKDSFLKSYNRFDLGEKALCDINWLPLNQSTELSELIGYVFSDGSVERSYDRCKIRPKRVDFISDSSVIRDRISFLFKELFDVKPTMKLFRNTKGLRVKNAAVARVLWLIGIPMGSKVSKNYDVPEWIKRSTKRIKKHFIRAYFDCDASKPFKVGNSKATFGIRVTINKTEKNIPSGLRFLNSMKGILKEFGIDCNGPYIRKSKTYVKKNGETTVMLELLIQRQLSFLNYFKHIGFTETAKKAKLKKCVKEIIRNSDYSI